MDNGIPLQKTSLGDQGYVFLRANDAPIEDFFVYGERSSGTNVTQGVLERAFAIPRNRSYGWKHGPPSFLAGSKRTLFVVSLRNAHDWAVSMYAKPYHATAQTRDQTFADFLTHPWMSVMDAPKAHGLNRARHAQQVLAPDRHPITGAPFENIFAMRRAKHQAWLGLANLGVNLAIVQSEAFETARQSCLDRIAAAFDLALDPKADLNPPYIFKSRPEVEARRTAAKAALDENRSKIAQLLNAELETALGYAP